MTGHLIKGVFLLALTNAVSHSQNFRFEEAELLTGEVNSSAEDYMPLLSPGDSQLFFTRILHKDNKGGSLGGSDIWTSELTSEGWSKPHNLLHQWNTNENNSLLGIHESGEIVYLLNTYDTRKGISFSKRIKGSWSKPESVKIKGVSNNGFVGFFVSHDYNHILISMLGSDSEGDQDIYVSNRGTDGKWSDPTNLGPTVNTSGFEISPFLTRDKRYLFFASNGHEGFGDADIFVCERLYDSWDVWSTPKNLGKDINSTGFDAYLSIASSNKVFFASNRESGLGMSDIYESRLLTGAPSILSDSIASLLKEAKELLNDNNQSETRSFLISFDPNSSEVSYSDRVSIQNYINQLPDNDYVTFNVQYLQLTNGDKKLSGLQKSRIKKVVTILRSNGIPEFNVKTKVSDNRTGDMTEGDIEVVAIPNYIRQNDR